ncbi:MAG: hypothetical protein ACE5JX_12205 [Acidobacteriota bacterium]
MFSRPKKFIRSHPLILLLTAAGLSEILYLRLVYFPAVNGPAVLRFLLLFLALFLLYGLSAWALSTQGLKNPRRKVWLIAAFGLLFRLTLVPAGLRQDLPLLQSLQEDLRGASLNFKTFLLYDQDIWRYLWEGHVWEAGFNPYLHAPADPVLDATVEKGPRQEVWAEVRDRVSYPRIAALYPPLAQGVFRLSHATFPGSVVGWKSWVILLECLSGLLLVLSLRQLGRPVAPGLLLFAWNPLLVKSFAGSGHYDALLLLSLSIFAYGVARGIPLLAYASLGMAALAKFVPLVLVFLLAPLLWSGVVLLLGVIALGYLPFVGGGLGSMISTISTFAGGWRFNSGPYQLLESTLGSAVALGCYLLFLLALLYALRKGNGAGPEQLLRSALWVLAAAIVLSPVVDPWYITWLLPIACLIGDRVWLAFSGIVFLAFLIMYDGVERPWVLALEYGSLLTLVTLDYFSRKETFKHASDAKTLSPAA